jgi:hypothetical protein
MKRTILAAIACALGLAVAWAEPVLAGPTPAQKCESTKLKHAGKYDFCRMKADSKAVKKAEAADYTKCDEQIAKKFGKADSKWGMECPTSGDDADIQSQVTTDADFLALKLAGQRFIDNGDGTVTDVDTGLQWEQKDDSGGIHDKDNADTWCVDVDFNGCDNGGAPDGWPFTTFLVTLNSGTSNDGNTISGCFAGHCDWRLPTIAELKTIVDCSFGSPCIDPIFGPTQSDIYWSATTDGGSPLFVWRVHFGTGVASIGSKVFTFYVRAVRDVPAVP